MIHIWFSAFLLELIVAVRMGSQDMKIRNVDIIMIVMWSISFILSLMTNQPFMSVLYTILIVITLSRMYLMSDYVPYTPIKPGSLFRLDTSHQYTFYERCRRRFDLSRCLCPWCKKALMPETFVVLADNGVSARACPDSHVMIVRGVGWLENRNLIYEDHGKSMEWVDKLMETRRMTEDEFFQDGA